MCSTEQKLCAKLSKFYTSGSRERGSLEFFNSPYVPMSFRFIAMFRKCAFVHIGEIQPPASGNHTASWIGQAVHGMT